MRICLEQTHFSFSLQTTSSRYNLGIYDLGSIARARALCVKMPSSDAPAASEPAKEAQPEASGSQPQKNGAEKQRTKSQGGAAPEDVPKPSGAELKKQAKAEKAARRAQAQQEKISPAAANIIPAGSQSQPQKSDGAKGNKAQQKKGGPAAIDGRSLPVRGGPSKTVAHPETPAKEDKTVGFFRHLYRPRTTTITSAGKEVHPAVLALGLQMSNYTICGSCARLVATLQAFKRVSSMPGPKAVFVWPY